MLQNKAGRIINMSSILGQFGAPCQVSLCLLRALTLSFFFPSLSSLSHVLSLSLSRFSLLLSLSIPPLLLVSSLLLPLRSSPLVCFLSIYLLHACVHSYSPPLSPSPRGPSPRPPAPALSMNLAGWPMAHSLALGVPSNACSSQRQTKI